MMFFGALTFGFLAATIFSSNIWILLAMGGYMLAKRGTFPIV